MLPPTSRGRNQAGFRVQDELTPTPCRGLRRMKCLTRPRLPLAFAAHRTVIRGNDFAGKQFQVA